MKSQKPRPQSSVQPGYAVLPRLGNWLLNTAVAALVWKAVKKLHIKDLRPVAQPSSSVAFQPINLLAILTYSYAVGIYGSQDVERMMREDAHFRELCQGEFPNWKTIQRFRRYNGEAIQRCLAATFRLAWGLSSHAGHDNFGMKLNSNDGSCIEDDVPVGGRRSEQEAVDRVEQAMWIDQMAMDDNEF